MNRPRRIRSPPLGYDLRVMGRPDPRQPPDYGDPYAPTPPFDPHQSAFADPSSHYPVSFRDHQSLPSTYRATTRDPYLMPPTSPPYKILCITNISQKVSDGPLKDALSEDFSRFGDISVSICHDSGERLAYIYFRTYEEAREARHTKARTLFFDRPIEIEPIYEPRDSPSGESPPPSPLPPPQSATPQPLPTQVYPERRRSLTPPEYYGMIDGPTPRRPLPPQLPPMQPSIPHPMHEDSPPFNYVSRHQHEHSSPLGPPPMPYHPGRYYMPPSHMNQHSPYSSPPHDPYRPYHHPQGLPPDPYLPHGYPPPHPYGPPGVGPLPPPPPPSHMLRERDRAFDDSRLMRSPRHEVYYQMDPYHDAYPPPTAPPPPPPVPSHQSSSRTPSSLHPSHHPNPSLSPNLHHSSSSSSSRSSRAIHPTSSHPEPPPRYMSREFRREKYGSENYGIEPEDGRPSRVLFVTNIDSKKTEEDLRDIFSPFGTIEELEVRKVSSNASSALIKFSSMDCAYKAKTATNGKSIGSMRCRITYSKISASCRLWIGGLGTKTTVSHLEDEFGKYGDIISMDYTAGRPYAYVEFETSNQAQFATHHIRGTKVAEADRRIRIEHVDSERNDKAAASAGKYDSFNHTDADARSRMTTNDSRSHKRDRNTSPSRANSLKRSMSPGMADTNSSNKRTSSIAEGPTSPEDHRHHQHHHQHHHHHHQHRLARLARSSCSRSPPDNNGDSSNDSRNKLKNSNQESTINSFSESERQPINDDESYKTGVVDYDRMLRAKNIRDVVECCPFGWDGKLVLRNFNFPSRLFVCRGQKETIEKYLNKNETNCENGNQACPVLKITQRWRLHPQPKLEEVKRRMQIGNLGMFIITSRLDQSPSLSSPSCKTPQSSASGQTPAHKRNGDIGEESVEQSSSKEASVCGSGTTQARPLKNLISYLEQKDAAGVISLGPFGVDGDNSAIDVTKLLYAFPPGEFALNLLRDKAPGLGSDCTKEEFLLGVIVGGIDTSKI